MASTNIFGDSLNGVGGSKKRGTISQRRSIVSAQLRSITIWLRGVWLLETAVGLSPMASIPCSWLIPKTRHRKEGELTQRLSNNGSEIALCRCIASTFEE